MLFLVVSDEADSRSCRSEEGFALSVTTRLPGIRVDQGRSGPGYEKVSNCNGTAMLCNAEPKKETMDLYGLKHFANRFSFFFSLSLSLFPMLMSPKSISEELTGRSSSPSPSSPFRIWIDLV